MEGNLLDFIRHARQKGMDHATIRVLLISAGWREKDIAKGLAEEGLDVIVPEPPSVGGAKEAFQYLLAYTSLCFVLGKKNGYVDKGESSYELCAEFSLDDNGDIQPAGTTRPGNTVF